MKQVWKFTTQVNDEALLAIQNYCKDDSRRSNNTENEKKIKSSPDQQSKLNDNNKTHQGGFPVIGVEVDLRPNIPIQQQLSLRVHLGKRKEHDSMLERAAKLVRVSSQSSDENHSTEEISTVAPAQMSSRIRSSRYVRVERLHLFEKKKKSAQREELGLNALSFVDFRLKGLSGEHFCDCELETQSEDEQNLWDGLLHMMKPDKNCVCRSIAEVVVKSEHDALRFTLRIHLLWKNAFFFEDALKTSGSGLRRHISFFSSLLTTQSKDSSAQAWTPEVFYESVYVPPRNSGSHEDIEVPGLRTGLYEFQARSLKWLLKRESFHRLERGKRPFEPSNGFYLIKDLNGQKCYFNPWLQLCTNHSDLIKRATDELKGGILAEEMGLGKTVEILSLVQMHKRSESDLGIRNGLFCTPATLIIAPKSIVSQWKEEIDTHAPGLRVMMYNGMKAHSGKGDMKINKMIDLINNHDVVLVTYEVLSKEIWYAIDPPERSRRYKRMYERQKSPLIQIDWWRVILDEAQMVESGVTNAARVAVQLPRQNAWAVTGTPLKKDSNDLFGLITFLRLVPYCISTAVWSRLVQSHISEFKALINSICLRHSKDQVRGELQLPPQRRFAISVAFTAVEEQNYSQLFEEMAGDCGLDLAGSPIPNLEDVESAKIVSTMRQWLVRLRQICLHPEVGDRNRRALGRRDGVPLRTVADVLQVMCEQNESSLRSEERIRLQSMLRRGQILEHAKQPEAAMRIWERVHDEIAANVETDRAALAEIEMDDPDDDETEGVEECGDKGDPFLSRTSRMKNRLRASLEVKHTATFFIANAIFQIKSINGTFDSNSEAFKQLDERETSKYEEAKQLRKELLASAASRAKHAIDKLATRGVDNKLVIPPKLQRPPFSGGLATHKYIKQLDLIATALNFQADLFVDWRAFLMKAVCASLVDQEDSELTGEEYEDSTKAEDQTHAYMEAMRLLVADRSQALTGQKNTNVRREASNLIRHAIAGEGHAPELMKALLMQCNKIRMSETQEGDIEACLRGVIAQLNHKDSLMSFSSGQRVSKQAEQIVAGQILSHIKMQATEQQKVMNELEKELDLFSDAVNARVEYYKQLQDISDLVAPYEENMTEEQREAKLWQMKEAEDQSQRRAIKFCSRKNYLEHLKSDSMTECVERKCIICQDNFHTGCLTSCGHVYCKECIMLWWKQHRTCPTCKATISRKGLFPITYKPSEIVSLGQDQQALPAPEASIQRSGIDKPAIYSEIRREDFDEIKAIDLRGSYGTKVDMLARHLLWIRQHDPGAKSVVFSQFKDFIEILEVAFSRFGIAWSSIDSGPTGVENFKKEPGIECLLLHAKAQASGLNLINATHVFLCEPLINTAIELQVVARVHRIGQHSPTAVWMYLIENTVEKAIQEISVERRMAHISSSASRQGGTIQLANGLAKEINLEDEIDAANSLEMEKMSNTKLLASGRSGGEQVAKQDLWPCLFKYRPIGSVSLAPDSQNSITVALTATD